MEEKGPTEKIKVPKEDNEHKGQLIAKGALGAIPFVGGAAGEFFDLVYKSGYEKRLEKWRGAVSATINTLCEKTTITIQDLIEDEEFQSILTEITLVGLKNHQETKLNSLLNLLYNSTSSPTNYDFKKLFVGYIDQFTEYHLRMLGVISENQKQEGTAAHKNSDEVYTEILESVFHGNQELMNLIHEELEIGKGLIKYRITERMPLKIRFLELSDLGQKFIRLIVD